MHCVAHNLKQLRSLFTRKFHPFSSTQVAEEPLFIRRWHRLSGGVFIYSGICTGAGILLSGSGVNVTGSSDVSCPPGGHRPPLRQRCRQLKSRLSLILFSWAICATQAAGKRVCWTSLHLNSGENWFRRVFSAFTGWVTVGAEGDRPGKESGQVARRNIHQKETGQWILGEIASPEKKWRFCWRRSALKCAGTTVTRQISVVAHAGSIPDYLPVPPFVHAF